MSYYPPPHNYKHYPMWLCLTMQSVTGGGGRCETDVNRVNLYFFFKSFIYPGKYNSAQGRFSLTTSWISFYVIKKYTRHQISGSRPIRLEYFLNITWVYTYIQRCVGFHHKKYHVSFKCTVIHHFIVSSL